MDADDPSRTAAAVQEAEAGLAPPLRPLLRSRRRLWLRRLAWLIAAVLIVMVALLWTQRIPIATDLVDQQLQKLGIPATYEITQIGPRTQRIENLRIGRADRPDLIVEEAELDLGWGLNGPEPVAVRARGVHLEGRFADGRLSFGALDKLRDPASKEPFRLPDLNLALAGATARIESDFGTLGLAFSGQGALRRDFAGQLGLFSPQLGAGGCRVERLRLSGRFALLREAPRLEGPASFAALACAQPHVASGAARLALDLSADRTLTRYAGQSQLSIGDLDLAGNRAGLGTGSIALRGDQNGAFAEHDLTLVALSSRYGRAPRTRLEGEATLDWSGDALAWKGETELVLANAALAAEQQALLQRLSRQEGGLPIDPIIARVSAALARAAADVTIRAPLSYAGRGVQGRIAIADVQMLSRSGVAADLSGGNGIALSLPDVRLALGGRLRLRGGDLPSAEAEIVRNPANGAISGQILVAPYAAGTAQLALDPLRFSWGASGISFRTAAQFSGPLPGGRIERAEVPLIGTYGRDGRVTLAGGCTRIAFESLQIGSNRAGPTTLPLCAARGAPLISFANGRLQGRMEIPGFVWRGAAGQNPLLVTADRIGIDLATRNISAQAVSVRIGDGDSPIRFAATQLTGAGTDGGGFAGRIENAAGRIGPVPLDLSGIGADWRYANGQLEAGGVLRFEDAAQVDRFNPMISKDFVLTYAGNDIEASGGVYEPTTGRAIAGISIAHSLARNAGRADINVVDLRFDSGLQPALLSTVVTGVVANVDGVVNGKGQIRWNQGTVTSDGTFSTSDMALAAAFGPVRGLSGEIRFTDLLGLQTAPGQVVRLASVNPGLEVVNGIVRYQLLPEQQVSVEGGTWEFAGGQLLLLPTVLDFSAVKPRRFLFNVRGVDAELFLYRFGYENLNATGIFDGELPIIFDAEGGRIENGQLRVRQGGGTIAYVGELTQYNLGTMANFAFNALKSLKYENLLISMNGDLAGEMITDVQFSGISQGEGASRNLITRQIAKWPLVFNISIKAPFRQLFSSVRGYYDPTSLVEQNRERLQEEVERSEAEQKGNQPVQPPESPPQP